MKNRSSLWVPLFVAAAACSGSSPPGATSPDSGAPEGSHSNDAGSSPGTGGSDAGGTTGGGGHDASAPGGQDAGNGSTGGGHDAGAGPTDSGTTVQPDAATVGVKPRQLGTITTAFDPAFLALTTFPAADTSLVITTFSGSPIGGTAGVSYVPSIGKALGALSSAKDIALVSSGMAWPNEAAAAPSSIFGADGLVVPGGFLVPGNTTGAVTFVDATGKATKITTDKTDWFYHRVVWQDMNGDKIPDALVARATKPLSGSPSGELLWLEAPASNPLAAPWKEHSLIAGANAPDVFLRTVDLDGNGGMQILAPQFFSQKLVLYWIESGTLRSVDIDDQIGSAFDVQFVDLNGDGKLDVLGTNSMTDGTKGAVFAYEIPASWKTDPWPKHTLTSGFTLPSNPLSKPAAPGSAIAFQPKVGGTGKPVIALSGDDSGSEWLLTPASASATDWTYTRTELVATGGTCGEAAVGDVDGDGWVELFVPAYGKKTVYAYTFAP